jgi:hypothetical protein
VTVVMMVGSKSFFLAPYTPVANMLSTEQYRSLSCLKHRGDSGRWVQDWQYANATNYPNHGSYSDWHVAAQNFTPSAEQPFRLATSYMWHDDNCPVSVLEKESFCQACRVLNISRILIVGDSMSIEFTRSLVSLLGYAPPKGPASQFYEHFRPIHIACPSSQKITVMGTRISPIDDWQSIAAEVSEIEAYRKSRRSIRSSSSSVINETQHQPKPSALRQFINGDNDPHKKTTIVANLGAWIESMEDYQVGFEALVQWLGTFDDKIVPFFRETIPGHGGCQPNAGNKLDFDWINPVHEKPFVSYQEYADSLETGNKNETHNWDLFQSFNRYSKQRLARSSLQSSTPTIHWLNVFNSSVLRRDGHVGWGDCLHYYLPGPPDWWVHFFHSALLDLASTENESRIRNAWTNTIGAAQ